MLLEGTHLLQEALKTSLKPALIIATSEWMQKQSELLYHVPNDVELIEVTQSVLEASLTTINPDGVASLFPLDALPKSNKEANFVLALDRLQDPGNLGTLFRTALAANIEEVWLVLGADPLGQKVLRSSAGSVLHLPFQRFAKSEEDSIGLRPSSLSPAALVMKSGGIVDNPPLRKKKSPPFTRFILIVDPLLLNRCKLKRTAGQVFLDSQGVLRQVF